MSVLEQMADIWTGGTTGENTLCPSEHLDSNESHDDNTNNEYGADESIDTIMTKVKAFNDLRESESDDSKYFRDCQGCG